MPQFDILVHVRSAEGESLSARAAFALARRLDACAHGMFVASLGAVAFSTPETVVFQVHEADHFYEEALGMRNWWQAETAAHGVAGDWLVAQGEPVEALCHAARWCDLVVAERPTLNPDAPTGWGTVSRTVFGAGTPVVVVPQTARVDTLGERIVIAWNHSRESIRAIHGALPLLQRAAQVTVLDGARREDLIGVRHLPHLDLRAYLARHEVKAEFTPFAPKSDHGAAILSAARDTHADLVVM